MSDRLPDESNAVRDDVHRPSFADPAEYTEVGCADLHWEQGTSWWAKGYPGGRDHFEGHYETDGHCDHCGTGSRLRFVTFFVHEPTQKIIAVGDRCAAKLGLESKSAATHKRLLTQERKRREREEWAKADPRNAEADAHLAEVRRLSKALHGAEGAEIREAQEALWALTGGGAIVTDIAEKLRRYGSLSEKQVDLVLRIRDEAAERAAEREAERASEPDPAPVPQTPERIQIEGKVVSAKWKSYDFGPDRHVMTVLDDRGFKVWGSVPASLDEGPQDTGRVRYSDGREEILSDEALWHRPKDAELVERIESERIGRGSRVRFMAAVERSDRDETFGFFKRPTKAEILDTEEEDR